MCIDGIAAYWFETCFRLPEAIEPQVWCTTTRVDERMPLISRGGASGNK